MQRNCVGLRKERAQREEKKGTDCIARLPCLTLPLSVIKFFFVYLHRTIAISLLLLLFYARHFLIYKTRNNEAKKLREVMAKKVSYGNDM